jgi:outer membrane biosynthesis protein TonB
MRLGATLSAGLHALVITLAWFGLPHLRADPPVLDDIVFVKLAELGDVTNVPPEAPEPIKTKPKADPIPRNVKPKPPPPPVRQAAIPPPPPAPIRKPKPKPEPAAVVAPPKVAPKLAPKPTPKAAPAGTGLLWPWQQTADGHRL